MAVLRRFIHLTYEEGDALISINYRDPRPIYEQVRDSLRRLILSGTMKSGERLPSVRDLSSTLTVNPNTVQRAYRELESEGYIYSVPGKGSFVADDKEIDQGRVDQLFKKMDEAAKELFYLGYSWEELARHIQQGGAEV